MKHYDIIVIGSGGGSKITRPAANLGKKVAIIEEAKLGGTCLNHGCIPSKMLIHPADVATAISESSRFEIDVNEKPSIRFKEMVDRVTATIEKDSNSIAPAYEKHPNIDFYPHHAHFIDNNTIAVNGEQITGDKIFIVTGGRPHIPEVKGLKESPFLTYKEALRLSTQPKHIVVVGGGFIATELGYFFGALGSKVTFLVRSSFFKSEDTDVIEEFTQSFSKRFDIKLQAAPTEVTYQNDEFNITYTQQGETSTLNADQLLVATGITPNADNLGLEHTSVQVNDRGFIRVNETMQTDAPNIYAFGDVVGHYQFRHSANFEGEYVFRTHVAGQGTGPIQYPAIPYAAFTNPQIGRVGKSEKDCQQENIPYFIGKNNYAQSAMGMALLSEEGFVKLIFEKGSLKLIGAHIVGTEASTMVHMLIAYIQMKGTLKDLLDSVYIHPALPEIVRNAARKALANAS